MNCFLNLFIIFTTIYYFLCYTTAEIFPNNNYNIAPTNTNKMPLTGPDINPLVQHSLERRCWILFQHRIAHCHEFHFFVIWVLI